MRPAARMVLTAALSCWCGCVVLAPAANADAPSQLGWWTVTNPGGSAAPPPPPPDVPVGGLLVQGGGDGSPTAFAAVAFELDHTTVAQRLTLLVAPGSATTPTASLRLCMLSQPLTTTVYGGPMAAAPHYDCAHSATASMSSTGNSFVFSLAGLPAADAAFAILPVAAVNRVVIAKPTSDALSVAHAPAAAATSTRPGSASAPARSAPVPAAPLAVTALPRILSAAPVAESALARPGQGPVPVDNRPPVASAPVRLSAAAPRSGGRSGTTLGVLAAVLIAAALWSYAGRTPRPALGADAPG